MLASKPERVDGALYSVMMRLDTTGLLLGDYQIRVVYRGADGKAVATASRDFEVRQ